MSTNQRAARPPGSLGAASGSQRPWLSNYSKTLGEFMPLKLKRLMGEFRISRLQLAEGVRKHTGEPYSESAISQLVNHSIYPRMTAVGDIQRQILARLAQLGVPEERLDGVFALDEEERALGAMASMSAAHSLAMTGRAPPAGFRRKARPRPETPVTGPEDDIAPVEPDMLSPAARKHFQFFRDPFSDDVNGPDDVFLSPDVRYVREVVYQTAKLGGMVAVVGESGAGKSVIRRDLIERIVREQAQIRLIQPRVIDKTHLSARHLCEAILADMAPNTPMGNSLETMARRVERVLVESSRAGNTHALVIEEAHDLTIQALKYLKRFWELEDGFRKLLAIILIGQPELKDKLDERVNFAAREVIRRCEIAELAPLDNHLQAYLEHKLGRVGKRFEDVLDESALGAIRSRLTRQRGGGVYSMLYPLVVNNLVTRALNSAAELGAPVVDADVVAEL